jgi:hypothetical protein
VLTIGPRHRRPTSDDLVLSVRHRTTGDPRSVLLSRAQVRELLDWLAGWYEHGWAGVRREEGPTSADIIGHFEDIAIRERIRADHERADAHRLLHAAIALIPAGHRSHDLDDIALAQGRAWARLTKQRDRLEQIRCNYIQGLTDIQYATTASADALRTAAGRLADRAKLWDGDVSDDEAADTPLYNRARLVTAEQLLPPAED